MKKLFEMFKNSGSKGMFLTLVLLLSGMIVSLPLPVFGFGGGYLFRNCMDQLEERVEREIERVKNDTSAREEVERELARWKDISGVEWDIETYIRVKETEKCIKQYEREKYGRDIDSEEAPNIDEVLAEMIIPESYQPEPKMDSLQTRFGILDLLDEAEKEGAEDVMEDSQDMADDFDPGDDPDRITRNVEDVLTEASSGGGGGGT